MGDRHLRERAGGGQPDRPLAAEQRRPQQPAVGVDRIWRRSHSAPALAAEPRRRSSSRWRTWSLRSSRSAPRRATARRLVSQSRPDAWRHGEPSRAHGATVPVGPVHSAAAAGPSASQLPDLPRSRPSANKYQLLKPTSGDKKDNPAAPATRRATNVPEKGSRHAALDLGGETCHVTHKTGADRRPKTSPHLTKSPRRWCIDRHDRGRPRCSRRTRTSPSARRTA